VPRRRPALGVSEPANPEYPNVEKRLGMTDLFLYTMSLEAGSAGSMGVGSGVAIYGAESRPPVDGKGRPFDHLAEAFC